MAVEEIRLDLAPCPATARETTGSYYAALAALAKRAGLACSADSVRAAIERGGQK